MISYSLTTSIPLTYHTQIQSWLNYKTHNVPTYNYYRNSELLHIVQHHQVIGLEYEGGESVWVAVQAYQLDKTANEEYDNRYSGKIDSTVVECEDDDDDDDECIINIKPKETKNITLSLHSSFILGSYSIGIREGRGTRDTLYFSHPIVTMGTSYTSTPQHSVITRPAPPSDSGAMQHTGTHPG